MVNKRKKPIALAIPSSLVAEHNHLREKTLTIGMIARAASIYRVEDIYIFKDIPDESSLIRDILNYVETPQYLRKKLHSKRQEFSYVGLLQPLRTPHHPREKHSRNLRNNEYREGILVTRERGDNFVDIGVDRLLKIKGKAPSEGSRVTTQILDNKLMIGRFVSQTKIQQYWGYKVHINKGKFSKLSGNFPLRVATSREGIRYSVVSEQFHRDWEKAKKVLIAFGSPRNGLKEILSHEQNGIDGLFDYELNMILNQGTATVRTEEAIHATLAILNQLDTE